MKISRKLNLGFLCVTVLLALVAFVAYWGISNIAETVEETTGFHMPALILLAEMQRNLTEGVQEAFSYPLLKASLKKRNFYEKMDGFDTLSGKAAELARTGRAGEEETAVFNAIAAAKKELVQTGSMMIADFEDTGKMELESVKRFEAEANRLKLLLERMAEREKNKVDEAHKNIAKVTARILAFIVFFSIATLTLALVAGHSISRGIGNSLARLKEAAAEIGRGRLGSTVELKSEDEIGSLAASFNMMSENLRISREELERSYESLRKLSGHMLTVREEERRLMALKVHDDIGQALSTLKLDLSWLTKRLRDPDLSDKTTSMSGLVDSTIDTVQRIASELRPPVLDDLGLVAAVESEAWKFQERTGIQCVSGLPEKDLVLERPVSESVFRVFQEAMINAARHAGATRVKVSLKVEDGRLTMAVKDNGRGITEEELNASTSFGLMGMRERIQFLGGRVEIRNQDKGTAVLIEVPLKKDPASPRHGSRP